MKKLILTSLAVAGITLSGFSQGIIYFDGSNNTSPSSTATSEGQVFLNGVLDTGTDINAELLWSSTVNGIFAPVATLLLSTSTSPGNAVGSIQPAAGDITFYTSGVLFDTTGNAYQFNTPNAIAAGTPVFFMVEGWTGNYSTFAAAQADPNSFVGATSAFSEVLTSATGTANDIEGMPALNLVSVPEPTALALAGLGGFGMLMALRRKQA